ncbi:MAG: hypothetical protein JSU65_06605 [Candidatus Zixiibacteriota bacterium]|nr:MAG: hypothetical protein JSU65_06605 [candidate division Zixibacteria bacterium]
MRTGFLTILLLLILAAAGSASDRLDVDGYFKSFFVAYRLPSVNVTGDRMDLPPLGSVSNRLRLNAHLRMHRNISFAASYDFAPRVKDWMLFQQPLSIGTIETPGYRFDDFGSRLYPSGNNEVASFAVFHNLDRAFLEFRTDRADFFVGRQPIAWGSARSVNPTDILTPYPYDALDTEDRVGVDAIRTRIPLGFMGEIDAGYVFGENFKPGNNAFFVRTKFYLARTDLSVLAIGYRENLMLGLEVVRSIGGAGFWLEAAHSFADAFATEAGPDGEDFFRATIGCDYSLGGTDYLFVEYHFNQAGTDDPDNYTINSTKTAYTEGSTYLLGRHYLIPGASLQVTPLFTASLEMLWNLSDGSVYVAPAIEYNVAENIYLAGGLFIGIGPEPALFTGMRSEFGTYPDMYYTSFRVYF